jgi:hypothetical protein
LPVNLGRALDLRRVEIYGHSVGGATAAEAMYEDRRIEAAVNLEGYLDYMPEKPGQEGELFAVAQYRVDRPLLLMGTMASATSGSSVPGRPCSPMADAPAGGNWTTPTTWCSPTRPRWHPDVSRLRL